jgi:hypothetical protein
MSEIIKSLVHSDRFKVEVTAERNGVLRLLGNFADGTGLNLRPDEVAVIRWRDSHAELVIERRPDLVSSNDRVASEATQPRGITPIGANEAVGV